MREERGSRDGYQLGRFGAALEEFGVVYDLTELVDDRRSVLLLLAVQHHPVAANGPCTHDVISRRSH
jgi:hypothetical protein